MRWDHKQYTDKDMECDSHDILHCSDLCTCLEILRKTLKTSKELAIQPRIQTRYLQNTNSTTTPTCLVGCVDHNRTYNFDVSVSLNGSLTKDTKNTVQIRWFSARAHLHLNYNTRMYDFLEQRIPVLQPLNVLRSVAWIKGKR
jgi:hypothetical protein